ncbi:MAG: type II toxin-antitoxin system VapB family antitoxin [Xanthobacteraceae bacterium]
MDVLIKRPTAVAKIRKLAKRTGETLTDAVERAVEARLAQVGPRRQKKRKGYVDLKKLAELLAYFDSLPRINEDLTDEEIIGYDGRGLPK